MNLTIPTYVERAHGVFTVRPLFAEGPVARNRDLQRATVRFTIELSQHLGELSKADRHHDLARLSFCPELDDREVKLTLFLRRHTARLRLLLVSFRQFDRRIVFSPQLPKKWFAVRRGEDLVERATRFYTDFFLSLERDEDDLNVEGWSLENKAMISTVEVDFAPRKVAKLEKATATSFFSVGGRQGELDGGHELAAVGRCLDWLYPDGLMRAFAREREVSALRDALASTFRRPVLLVGPPKVGKTAIIHERIHRIIERRGGRFARRRQHWLVAPQRLIAGMSYVGQWEQRVLAIIKKVRRARHILCFDDLLGLFQAGISSQSSLSVGQMIKPFIERKEISILAEITPQAFAVLQEVDRGFADLFLTIRVEEPSEEEVLSILIHQLRELEGRHRCTFHPAVLPRVIDLQRRYARRLAFPGKAALFLEQLAVKYRRQEITDDLVLGEFHRKSGLSLAFLDEGTKMDRADVTGPLEEHVKGQHLAVEAMADTVSIGKARLQDPTRPLASLLFLGPTGVGKTQSAKALARYLFGDETKLIRFDMNEYGDPIAPGRLVGTFMQPAGSLTSAVQQNPFSVVLLDEIEKAHPEVFNLLLQVLDDGRLTDAMGRTADFTSTIVILTSNLGAEDARSAVGFSGSKTEDGVVYTSAAEAFFRPELFNRLDRIIPFSALARETTEDISIKVIQEVFGREGLRRRKCLLDIHPRALEAVAREGYVPQHGARALKRVVERRITRPVATLLAALTPDRPIVVSVFPVEGAGFGVHLEPLVHARRQLLVPAWLDETEAQGALLRIDALTNRIEEQSLCLAPGTAVCSEELQPAHSLYFELREQIALLRENAVKLAETLEQPGPDSIRGIHVTRPAKRLGTFQYVERWDVNELFAAQDLSEYLDELTTVPRSSRRSGAERLADLYFRAALLDLLYEAGPERAQERAMLVFSHLGLGNRAPEILRGALAEAIEETLPLETSGKGTRYISATGPAARTLLEAESGTHLVWQRDGGFTLVKAETLSLNAGEAPREVFESWLSAEGSDRVGRRAFPPIIRVHDVGRSVFDLRTGILVRNKGKLSTEDHRPMLLSQLPIPSELRE